MLIPNVITLDLETENLDPYHNNILLIGYRYDGNGPVTVVRVCDGEEPDELFREALRNPLCTKRGHNTHFDLLCLVAKGYTVDGPVDDSRILAYLENPQQELDLKGLTERRLHRSVVRMEDFGQAKISKHSKKYLKNHPDHQDHALLRQKIVHSGKYWVSKNTLAQYNKADVINCDDLKRDLVTTNWYRTVEQPLSSIILKAEQRGLQLDIPHLEKLKNEFTQKIEELKKEFNAGEDFNPGSWQQVKECYKSKGTILESTDKHTIKLLYWKGDTFAKTLLEFRSYSKLLGTYVEPFLAQSIEGRLHGRFNQAGRESESLGDIKGTATGRLSSSEPNLQNIPDRTEAGKRVRKAIISTPGFVLGDSDLKQIEPRLVAHYTQSKRLLDAYANGLDTHTIMGASIFNKKIEDVSKIERFIGKTSWLATFYGAWYTKLKLIAEINSDDPLYYDEDFYKKVQDSFWADNPDLSRWKQIHLAATKAIGGITTIGGRFIKITGLNSYDRRERAEAERMAVNYLIQGSAADIMKMISVEIGKQKGISSLAWVHDEVLFEYDLKVVPQGNLIVKNIMENTVKLNNVKIESDTKIINNWSEK